MTDGQTGKEVEELALGRISRVFLERTERGKR